MIYMIFEARSYKFLQHSCIPINVHILSKKFKHLLSIVPFISVGMTPEVR